MTKDRDALHIILTRERETKNTIRYAEDAGDEPPIIGTLYVQRWALKALGNPDRLVITITAEKGGS